MDKPQGRSRTFVMCFVATFFIFGLTNIVDQLTGNSENTRHYPLFIFLIWTAVVASFHYLGWKVTFIVNAVPLYGFMVYTMFNHEEQTYSGVLSSVKWLIGTLPLPPQVLVWIPILLIVSILVQLIVVRFGWGGSRKNAHAVGLDEDE